MELEAVELAWMAGVFEGEGSVRITPFQRRWPGYLRMVDVPAPRRPYWRWRIAANVAARMLAELYPYLRTERVRAKAALGLEYQAQKSHARTAAEVPS